MPIAGFATLTGDQLTLEGRVGSVDGGIMLQGVVQGSSQDAEQLGMELAKDLLSQGAGELLKALH